jgi:DNA-binding SARP family transcriptional activator/DNA-binding XRE family transcriptional regulator
VVASAQEPASGLGGLLRQLRARAALTQQEVADLADLSVAALRDLEQGRVTAPRSATLRRLATALRLSGADADELLRLGRPGQRPAGGGLRILVLGPLAVTVAGAAVEVGSARARAVLGLLALTPNAPVGRDALIEIGWGGATPANAGDLLQTHISRLRRRLAPPNQPEPAALLVATAGGYQLTATADDLDLLAFRAAVAAGRRAHAAGDLAGAADAYRRAADLWRAEPLAGEPAFDLHPAVRGLVREWQAAVLEHADTADVLGRHAEVLPALERFTAAEPLHEAAHARLMLALAGTGQQAAALDRFERLRRRLADELGADPGAELAAAHLRVLRQEVTRPAGTSAPANRQLPPDLADFTGRAAELADLHGQLASDEPATSITITAIEGMAGVGKTRLAVHLSHELLAAGRYADVQLYVDLRGHADEPPADPATVLASFLHLLGTPGGQIPVGADARAALYRDRLHGLHALVLLDNAASEAQVRPLLPAGPTNLVLVTSRRALALDGSHNLALDVFSPADAERLLVRIVGRRRVEAEPAAAHDLVELCGRLPLAVALAARRLQARPAWSLADLVRRLRETGDRLGELTAGSRQLRAVFDLSYRALDPPAARLFRLLGLHPGDTVSPDSAAALAGLTPADAGRLLDLLVDEHLATLSGGDRYRLHDLIREYARQVTEHTDTEPDRRAAVTRLLDYYLHATVAAGRLIAPHERNMQLIGDPPAHLPALASTAAAEQWLEGERAALTAAVLLAADGGWPGHAWRLADALGYFLYLHGYPEDWEQVSEAGLRAVQTAADVDGEVTMRSFLAWTFLTLDRFDRAFEQLHAVVELRRQAGDRSGLITALANMSGACIKLGRIADGMRYAEEGAALVEGLDPYREAFLRANQGVMLGLLHRPEEGLAIHQLALDLCRQAGDHASEPGMIVNIGDSYRRLGRYEEAARTLEQALAMANEAGLAPNKAVARHSLGVTYHALGRTDEALDLLAEALRMIRSIGGVTSDYEVLIDTGAVHRDRCELDRAEEVLEEARSLAAGHSDRYLEARALAGLAEVHLKAGRTAAARERWEQARDAFAACGTPDAAQITARLAILDG